MILTDTHTHIYLPELEAQIDAIIRRATDQRVKRFFLPNIDAASIPQVYGLAAKFPDMCFPMMGLHPCSVKEDYNHELEQIAAAMEGHTIYAIGEIGIDLYWDRTFLVQQQDAFRRQIQWAKERDLPIVIHCRDAFDEVYEILLEQQDEKLRGIFHCFSGTLEQAGKIIALDGFYLGIGGVVTYKNSGLAEVVKQVDLRHIVLETDSPYLTPVPFRGKPNESSYLIYVAEKLSDIYGISVEKIADITTQNSIAVFGR